jgi:hypothetical protein
LVHSPNHFNCSKLRSFVHSTSGRAGGVKEPAN